MRRALLIFALLLASRPGGAQSAADVEQARELFKQAAAQANDGDWVEAEKLYTRSLALKRAPITLYSLGVAQMNAGLLVESLESLRGFLLAMDASTAQYEAPARGAITELEAKVAHAKIVIEPANAPGLSVMLNGGAVPLAGLGLDRPVNPGRLELSARADGHQVVSETREVEPGGRVELTLRLVPAKASAPTPSSEPASPEQPRGKSPLPWILIGGGAGVAVVGGVIGVLALGDAGDARDREDPKADSARSKALIADIAIGVGSAAALTGVVLLIAAPSESAPRAALRPLVSPERAGAELRVVF